MQNSQALHLIFAYLSRRSVCILQLVCKRWYTSIIPSNLYSDTEIPIPMNQKLIRLNCANLRVEVFEPDCSDRWQKYELATDFRYHNYKITRAGHRYFLIGGKEQYQTQCIGLTSPCVELVGGRRLVQRAHMLEQRDWCSVASLIKSDGQRFLYAIGGKTFSQVDLRSIEKYDVDKDRWSLVKTQLNMKTGIFTAVTVFENRYIYIMAHDCLSLEVLDTERSETMCTILNLKTPLDCQEMMRPILLPLNDTEILYL